ncbi:protoheme IX farnesyltransferase [Marivirga lumbricoides]|uniref:Protoheme IX farnesyltransferase n=1 Tax=Marivirga lumbricoides TaxID=1046115 RepID=A0A2T4DSV6_9BACT|nr:protoheme IX farnesyltransferase [Marivirga lumbricoides]
MQYPESQSLGIYELLGTYLRGFYALLKPRLSFLVAFSSAFGYVLGFSGGSLDWMILSFLVLGAFLVSGSAITINQIIEVEYDKKMDRTKNRPLPTGVISRNQAIIFSIVTGVTGLVILLIFTNLLTASLSLLSLMLYSFVYTPLKRVGPVAVFVGAIPGALPPLLGWVAATNGFSVEAWIIFGIQFIWQFPHFWAIAWVADEDYKKAGFKLLPSGGQKDLNTAIQIMIYTLFLIPLGLLPTLFGITGVTSALVATICGVLFLSQTFYLMKECTKEAALKIMFGSFFYLPIVQVAYLLDKI